MGKFTDQVKGYLDKGVAASKIALDKAGTVVQGLGELGVLKFEHKKLSSDKKKTLQRLGSEVYSLSSAKDVEQISFEDEKISGIIKELKTLDKEISKREKKIKAMEKDEKR